MQAHEPVLILCSHKGEEEYQVDVYLLHVAMVLLGLLCRINKLLHCGQGAGICIGCEYQVLIG